MRQVQGPETGGAVPRGAHSGSHGGVALGGLALLAISPAAFLAAIVTVFVVLRQVRRHWWEWGLAAVAVALAIGAVMQVMTGNVLAAHFGGYAAAITAGGSWVAAIGRTVLLG